MPAELPTVQFCFRCGRRVDVSNRRACWYCGAPTVRELRKLKKCPYCGEQIAGDAIKCKHCGEFVDGRPAPAAAPPPQQVVYVIDKEVLRQARDRALPPGQPVPGDVARHLEPETLRAIEMNQPALIHQPGVRALPAPEAKGIIDVAPQDVEGSLVAQRGLARSTQPSSDVGRPAPPETAPGLGQRLARLFTGRETPRAEDEPVETREDPTFRVCERCGAEILTSDNYCYHCGMQYHLTNADVRRMERAQPGPPVMLIVLVILNIAAVLLRGTLPITSLIGLLLAATSLLWAVLALILQRGPLAKITAVVLIIVAVITALAFT